MIFFENIWRFDFLLLYLHQENIKTTDYDKKFNVMRTLIYNGNVEIEADTKEEALIKVRTNFECYDERDIPGTLHVGDVPFEFGEMTADYADDEDEPLVEIVVSDIDWDTDDVFLDQLNDDERPELPDTVSMRVPDDFDEAYIEEEVIEPYLEINYGFCVNSFTYEIKRS